MAQSSSSSFKPDDNTIKQWFAQLQEFKSNGTFCDITLKAGKKEIQAHRLILAISIPFFSRMLQSNFREKSNRTVEIKNIDSAVLDKLVNLSYGAELEINHQNVEEILIGADYLHLDFVKTACEDFLKTNLTARNVIGTKKIAEKLYCGDLVSATEKFIDNNFPDFAKSDGFLDLEKQELIQIIKRDELNAKEEEVYQAVMKWIKYEGLERLDFLPEVLSNVRLCLLSPEFLCNSVSKESLIKVSIECKDLVEEAMTYHLTRTAPIRSIRCHPRRKFGKIYVLGGQNSNGNVASLQIYDIRDDKWIIKAITESVQLSGSAVYDGKIYTYEGGSSNNQRPLNVKIFDMQTEKFTRDTGSLVGATAAAYLDEFIYVSSENRNKNLSKYSPKNRTWTERAPLKNKRSGYGMVALNGQIYVIGGFGNNYLKSCERYDPESNNWSCIKPMTSARYFPGVAVLNGKIYVCGGWAGKETLNSTEIYDPVENVWTQAASMKTKRYGHALVSDGRKLYAIGGKESGSDCLRSCEVYDPDTDSWRFLASLIAASSGMSFGIDSN